MRRRDAAILLGYALFCVGALLALGLGFGLMVAGAFFTILAMFALEV
jgi:hypothetical protein